MSQVLSEKRKQQDILNKLSDGRQLTQIVDSDGNAVAVTANALNVSLVSGAAIINVDTEFPAASAITDNFASPITTSIMSMLMGFDGAAWDRLLVGGGTEAAALRITIASDSTGVLSVDDNAAALSIDIGGVAPQLDDTDKIAVSLYGAGAGGAGTVSTNIGPGTEAGALRVTLPTDGTGVVRLGAGEAHAGAIGGNSVLSVSSPVMTVGGGTAYSTGDYIGTTTTPQAFTLVTRNSGGTSIIKSIVISDKNTTAAVALELWVFSATFVAPTDNAAWSITDAEAATCLGVIPISASKWYASALNKVFTDDTLSLIIKPAVTSLFYALVARGTTPTWTSLDLQISIGILQD